MVVKDILISGIEDSDIRKDVLGITDIDSKTDKDIVKFVEEKEIARNALQTSMSTAALSSYNKSRKVLDTSADIATKKKLAMRSKCETCTVEISPYKQYRGEKLNKDPFKTCVSCHKKANAKKQDPGQKRTESSEASAILSFIGAIQSLEDSKQPAVADDGIDCAAAASGELDCAASCELDTGGSPGRALRRCR